MSDEQGNQPVLVADQISVSLAAASFAELLDDLAAFAVSQSGVADRDRFLREVAALGAEDTIAVGGGAFLLHLRSDAIDETVTVLGVTDRPLRVPTEAREDTRGRIFALVAAPTEAHGPYLENVATLAALLRQAGVTDAIVAADDPAEVAGLEAVERAQRIKRLSVVDVMEPASQRVYPDMMLAEAARLMVRGQNSALPVVNKNDEILGMISEKDLIDAFLPDYLKVFEGSGEGASREGYGRTVRDVMSKTVLCLPIEASISEAASIIVNKDVDPLPLTREGKWVGLISRRSLIQKLLRF